MKRRTEGQILTAVKAKKKQLMGWIKEEKSNRNKIPDSPILKSLTNSKKKIDRIITRLEKREKRRKSK